MKKACILFIFGWLCIALWIIIRLTKHIKTQDTITIDGENKFGVESGDSSLEMEEPQTPSETPQDGCINVNTSDLNALCLISGIGPSLADRIMSYRTRNGAFRSIEELCQIKGINVAKLEKMRSQICL